MELWKPMRWKFTDPDDIAAYGDRWWVWDETEITRLRGREIIALEFTVDLQLLDVIRGLRTDATLQKMAAMWISMHRAGHPVLWADFNPIVHRTSWEQVPEEPGPLARGEDPGSGSDSSPVVPAPEESLIS